MRTFAHVSSPKPRVRRIMRRRLGGSVLEIVLVMPILLMLSLGLVDYGYFMYVKNTEQGAAQAAARAASMASATNSSTTAVITNMMTAAGLQNSGYQVTFSPSDVSTAAAGSTVTVTVSCNWGQAGTHGLSSWLGGISNTKQVVGVAVVVKEST